MITVVNKHTHIPTEHDIYVGRGSVLGNPYTSKYVESTLAKYQAINRNHAVALYHEHLHDAIKNGDVAICNELKRIAKLSKSQDINLVCFCKPLLCHAEIIKSAVEQLLAKHL